MSHRREFLRSGIVGLSSAVVFPALRLPGEARWMAQKPPETADEEDFWEWVHHAFTVSPNIINLNNGGVSPQPKVVQEALETYNRLSSEGPSYYMWRILDKGREPLRERLAEQAGVSPEEVAINRNASESLETIIFGLDLQPGDEVVVNVYDYPNMLNAWKQREMRDKIKLVYAQTHPLDTDDEALAQAYISKFSRKTRVVHITHVINWNGQILPVRKIAEVARERGIRVLVDGAHAFAHLNHKISDLLCDFWGTSLHKWLCAPIGSGMMYIRKERISEVWPLFAPQEPRSGDIRKFEALGTRSFPIEQAIGHALNFHQTIGDARKEQRLRALKNYWVEKVKHLPGIRFYSPLDDRHSCALATVGFEGVDAGRLESHLLEQHKIHVTTIKYEGINGVRVTPHVYTRFRDLDRLVAALEHFARTPSLHHN